MEAAVHDSADDIMRDALMEAMRQENESLARDNEQLRLRIAQVMRLLGPIVLGQL